MSKYLVLIICLFVFTGCSLITGKIDVNDVDYSLSDEQQKMYNDTIAQLIEENFNLNERINVLFVDSLSSISVISELCNQTIELRELIEILNRKIGELEKAKMDNYYDEPSWLK